MEVRVRTLQGCLFLLQAISYEDLKSVFLLLESFLLENLQASSAASHEYETMCWTVGFFFFDNASYSSENSRGLFINTVCENFVAYTATERLMNFLTAGIERLIVGSRIYVLTFSRIAVQLLENYFNVPQKFIYALRVFIACLYRGLEEGRARRLGTQSYDPRIHLMEQHATIFKILAEGAEQDAVRLMKVLPYLLIDSLNQSELINSILKELIHRYTDRPHPRSAAIFTIIHHVSCSIRCTVTLILCRVFLG
ncbi:unnamed protein product [Gongylonema pulchrum]|uniref:Transformation transcription domain-associated n=1 Tax=Gongylonema pulchrum TaxID=637853 RepID=A0A183D1H1_9BILA|nr:unnamed protein product [Gongylonema pulchrum]